MTRSMLHVTIGGLVQQHQILLLTLLTLLRMKDLVGAGVLSAWCREVCCVLRRTFSAQRFVLHGRAAASMSD